MTSLIHNSWNDKREELHPEVVLAALNYFRGGCGVKDEPMMMEMLRLLYSYVRQVSGNTKSVRRI